MKSDTRARIRPSLVAALVAGLACLGLGMSGPGTRFGVWGFRVGLKMMTYAGYAGGTAVLLGAVALLIALARRQWRDAAISVLCIVAGAAAHHPTYLMNQAAHHRPPIHDVTTDTADPPAFVKVLPLRSEPGLNPAAYGGPEVARQQKEAYPDLTGWHTKLATAEAFQRALAAVKRLNWELVDADPSSGRIEATETTAFFGFKDDVVIRIRPEGAGSLVDVRSVSRVGRGDLGKNADRIRAFLSALP